jgi:hypothetical protein
MSKIMAEKRVQYALPPPVALDSHGHFQWKLGVGNKERMLCRENVQRQGRNILHEGLDKGDSMQMCLDDSCANVLGEISGAAGGEDCLAWFQWRILA